MSGAFVAVALSIAVSGAACGPKPPPTSGTTSSAPPDAGATIDAATADLTESQDPLAAAVERIVTLYEAIATLPSATTCGDAAVSIDRWTTERADAMAQVRDAAQGEQAELVDGLFHDASPRLSAAMKAVDTLATRCASEPSMTVALTRLSTEASR